MVYVPAKRLCDVGGCGREAVLTLVDWDISFCLVHSDVFDAACMAYLKRLCPEWADLT